MPTPAGPFFTAGTIVVLVGGLAVAGATLDVSEDMGEQVRLLVASTMRDVTVGWLDVVDAQGHVANGSVDRLDLLVRADGMANAVALEGLIVLAEDGTQLTLANVTPVRDVDGSLTNGTLNADDLARVSIALDRPGGRGEKCLLSFLAPEGAPVRVHLQVPRFLGGERVTLDVLRSW